MAVGLDEGLRQSNARFVASIERILERYNHPFEDDFLISMQTLSYDTPDGPKHWENVSTEQVKKWKKELSKRTRGSERNEGEESDSVVSVRRKLEDVHLENLYADDGKIQEKEIVEVDVIVQDHAREIPKWVMIAPCSLEGHHLSSPVPELNGNQAAVCRKKVKSNECSSSRPLQLEISRNTITKLRHRPSPEMNDTCDCSILGKYQYANEECFWNDITLADMYPAMVEVFRRIMTTVSWRKELKRTFRHLRHKKRHSRRPKLNATVNKGRGGKPLRLKQGLPSTDSSRREDIQNQSFRIDNRELHDDRCSTGNFSGLVPCSYIDTNEINVDWSDSSSELNLLSGKQAVSSNVVARMGEKFIVEDEVQTTVSLKNSGCKESEKLPYKHSSRYSFTTSTASSESTALDLVKESKAQKTDFPCSDTSGLCSSACSSYHNRNTFMPAVSCSLARLPNTSSIKPDQAILESQLAFQGRHSLSSLHSSPLQMPQKHEDAFDKLYNSLCSQEIQRPLTLTRPLSNSQNLEGRGLLKRTLSYSVKSDTDYDREFDRIYEHLCSEAVPKLPRTERSSNLRKYEGIQMSETVNSLLNSPIQTLSATPKAKRLGNLQNDFTCSPVKRLKHIPEQYFPSPKRQQISHRKNVNLQTAGMDFLSTYNGSNPSFFDSHSCQSQDFGFRVSSDESVLSAPGTSLQESGIAGPHSGLPRTMKNYSSPGNARKCHRRVSRKLTYTDEEEQNPSKTSDNFLVASHQGTFMN